MLAEERELVIDEAEIRDAYGDDPAGTVVRLANQVELLRREVNLLNQTVNGLYDVLREVAPDKLSRYELKKEIRTFLEETRQ